MDRVINQFAPQLYAVLRIVAGLLFAMHGSQKLFGMPGGGVPVEFMSLMGFAGMVELICGMLIVIGLFTRIAAFLASGQMAVAFFMAHFPKHPLPLLNEGEPATLFCFIFLFICAQGPGIWSLDKQPKNNKS